MPRLPPKHDPWPKTKLQRERERKQRVDRARADKPERKWLRDPRWIKRREEQLAKQPWCKCGKKASHADHDPPHKGDEWLFFTGALKSKCASCHNRDTARYDGGFGNPIRPRPPG